MNNPEFQLSCTRKAASNAEIVARIAAGCERIAPIWPLDQWVAVNPWWGHRQEHIEHVDAELHARANIGLLMPSDFYLDAWQGGRIQSEDLIRAAQEQSLPNSVDTLVSRLRSLRPRRSGRNLPLACADHLDAIRLQLGGFCARYFDNRQARWGMATKGRDLYELWVDRQIKTIGLGKNSVADQLASLPTGWQHAAAFVVAELPYVGSQPETAVHQLLLQLLGWSSWCRGEDWRAGLEGQSPGFCSQLATILLVHEWLAARQLSANEQSALLAQWTAFNHDGHDEESRSVLWTWHRAYEIHWQKQFLGRMQVGGDTQKQSAAVPEVQAAFCIDVRSEVLRRHLEACYPTLETLGVAGFFGMPVAHRKLGPSADEAQLPGLLAPAYRFVESRGSVAADRNLSQRLDHREQVRESVRGAKYSSLSTFTLVETTGLAWAWKLLRDSLHHNPPKKPVSTEGRLFHRYGGDPLSDPERIDLAESLLRAMSLTHRFASLLLLVGHGTHTDNNPNEAGLACGACSGKNGGINASIAAGLLNDRCVRAGLADRGIVLPESTLVLAAEHCTVTDEVRILATDAIPQSHQRIYNNLVEKLRLAAKASRRERATPLRLNGNNDQQLLAAMKTRTRNWAEVRPEWGLANNAAMIIGPRYLTRAVNLGGRCFLQEYNADQDHDGSVLSALMSAPMVVANWINLQYFASVTQPSVYGSGNKLLHSVVGGNLGVIEGNGVDLRIGLPWQSVHDGERWRHEPMRLTVLIHAPAERIEQVLSVQPDVRALVDNRWLWLWRAGKMGVEQYRDGHWLPM